MMTDIPPIVWRIGIPQSSEPFIFPCAQNLTSRILNDGLCLYPGILIEAAGLLLEAMNVSYKLVPLKTANYGNQLSGVFWLLFSLDKITICRLFLVRILRFYR